MGSFPSGERSFEVRFCSRPPFALDSFRRRHQHRIIRSYVTFFAMVDSIQEVDQNTNNHPNEKSQPSQNIQVDDKL